MHNKNVRYERDSYLKTLSKIGDMETLLIKNKDSLDEIVKLINELEKLTKSKLFCLIDRGEDVISYPLTATIRDLLIKLGKVDKITVLINSFGGNIDSAYRIINTFYQYAKTIEAIVVYFAKSAATAICLGVKVIYMGKEAELGPLDPQLQDPYGNWKSSLNIFKSLVYIRQYSIETLENLILLFERNFGMSRENALREARCFVSDILKPLYEQVNSKELGDTRRELAIAEEYGKKIMILYNYDLYLKKGDKIVKKLIWDYPSHGYIIDSIEAKVLGLNIEDLDTDMEKKCKDIISKSGGCIGFIKNKKVEETNES